jgi:hypothetical protein
VVGTPKTSKHNNKPSLLDSAVIEHCRYCVVDSLLSLCLQFASKIWTVGIDMATELGIDMQNLMQWRLGSVAEYAQILLYRKKGQHKWILGLRADATVGEGPLLNRCAWFG